MRGARGTARPTTVRTGIIPADAGSTRTAAGLSVNCRDHPRGCGEHKLSLVHCQWIKGSSPRMRGAPVVRSHRSDYAGIIPADAGSTCVCSNVVFAEKDHPRGCGEHRIRRYSAWRPDGSSPRMRGAPFTARSGHDGCGIIPADAGSTSMAGNSHALKEDHPRGCGEHNF